MNPITPLTPDQVAAAEVSTDKEGYLMHDAVGVDIFVNELTGGQMDETISSRASRAALEGKWWGKTLSKALNLFQKDHGANAEAGDVARAKNVIAIEDSTGILETK